MRSNTDSLQRRVERTVPRKGFAAAERLIDRTKLPEERRAALWLYAWSLQPSPVQRREARTLYQELG
jgi:hypothetical protein